MEEKKQKWLAAYFSSWQNCLTFAALVVLAAAGFYLRIRNLGYLSFWGDDGHTVIGTLSILKHGYPLLPSGFILFHSILSYYLNIIFVLIFGPTEFAFRLPSVLLGCGSIIIIYFFGKEIANKFTGFLAAFIITFSTWYIHFAREARYYQALQFFVLISLYFFYKGFVKEQKPYRIAAVIFFMLSPLVHGNAFFLILAFIALLFYRGRKFFKKHIVIPLGIISGFYIFLILNQVFFWRVGRSFYAEGEGQIRDTLAAYFRQFEPYYFKILNIMFPEMSYVVISAAAVFIGLAVFISVKKSDNFSDFYLNENKMATGRNRAGFPFNLFMLCFILLATLIIFSFGRMYNQQRYIYFLMPVFILIFSYTVFVASLALGKLIQYIYKKITKSNIDKKILITILCVIFAVISFFTVSGINLKEAHAIPDIKHSDSLNTLYTISTVMPYHWDAALPGKYVAENLKEGDIVITTDIYNSYPYTRKIDYWLWTGDLISWRPYHQAEDGELRDDTHGVELIRDFFKFIEIFNENHDKNVWVICSYSLTVPEHVDSVFADFFERRNENLVLTGRDNVTRLYYFPETENPIRLSVTDFIEPLPENILRISIEDEPALRLDFTEQENEKYLTVGWSRIEQDMGCWATGRSSVLFFEFDKDSFDPGAESSIALNVRPLEHPALVQSIDLQINGKFAGSAELTAKQDFDIYKIDIAPDILSDGVNTIVFQYDYSLSPKELGLGPDTRSLSVLFKQIEITGQRPFTSGVIPIVALHGIEPDPRGRYEISTDDFEKLCEVIKEFSYSTITFYDLLEHIEDGKSLPEKPVIITSDDGYRSLYDHAYPILKKYGLKMTVFLTTGFIEHSEKTRSENEFDFDVPDIPRRQMLIWPEIVEMAEYGLEFQSHGVTHKRLGEIPESDSFLELERSREDIEKNLGRPCFFISWPHNSYSDALLAELPNIGYRGAITYRGGIESLDSIDIYVIKRIPFYSNTGPANYSTIMELK